MITQIFARRHSFTVSESGKRDHSRGSTIHIVILMRRPRGGSFRHRRSRLNLHPARHSPPPRQASFCRVQRFEHRQRQLSPAVSCCLPTIRRLPIVWEAGEQSWMARGQGMRLHANDCLIARGPCWWRSALLAPDHAQRSGDQHCDSVTITWLIKAKRSWIRTTA